MDVEVQIQVEGAIKRRERIRVDGALSVGRASYSTLFLDGDLISRTHALIDIEADGLKVEDTSSNGTRAGAELLRRSSAQVPFGTPIVIGEYTLFVSLVSPASIDPKKTVPAPPPEVAAVSGPATKDGTSRSASEGPPADKSGGGAKAVGKVPSRPPLPKPREASRPAAPLTGPSRPAAARLVSGDGGPLARLIEDPSVTLIMVTDPQTIFVEQNGERRLSSVRLPDDEAVLAALEWLLAPTGVRPTAGGPVLDTRLPDGTRVHAVLAPAARRGTCVTIRKPDEKRIDAAQLVGLGTWSQAMATFMERTVRARKNVLISGSARSGKTTMLNVLVDWIADEERIVLLEEAAELHWTKPHVVALSTARPVSGPATRPGVIARDLLRASLTMEADRIVVGDCRGAEALELLHTMCAHDGTMTCINACSAAEAVARIEASVRAGGYEMSQEALRALVATSLHVLVQLDKFADGSRKVVGIDEVRGLDDRGRLVLHPIFEISEPVEGKSGTFEHRATGYKPSFAADFVARGFVAPGKPVI